VGLLGPAGNALTTRIRHFGVRS